MNINIAQEGWYVYMLSCMCSHNSLSSALVKAGDRVPRNVT